MVRGTPKAVVFDMDGVLVDSARVHARAWKEAFDRFLARRGTGDRFVLPDDYRRYVDGRPRYEGVASYLAARGIELPMGDPSEAPGMATMAALGNLKNKILYDLLAREEIQPLEGVIELLDGLAEEATPIALVSSSRNTDRILPEQIEQRVDIVLSGKDLDAMQLPGKPQPHMFHAAVENLGLRPIEAAVVEDSAAGVKAGRRGGFSLVIGVGDDSDASWITHLADIRVGGVSQLPPRLGLWPELLPSPPPAMEHVDAILSLIGERLQADPTLLYIGNEEDELLAVRQRDGLGVIVSPAPVPMTWADYRIPDQEHVDALRSRVAGAVSSSQ